MKNFYFLVKYSIIFLCIFLLGINFTLIEEFDIFKDPLSVFGISSTTEISWKITLLVISILIWIKNRNFIKKYDIDNKTIKILNDIVISTLILSTFIDMNFGKIHDILSLTFIVLSIIFIFSVSYITKIKRFLYISLFTTSITLLSTMSFIIFDTGYALTEIVFILSTIYWYFKMD
jgi:hypothetical protein